jgi:hypothetical protein
MGSIYMVIYPGAGSSPPRRPPPRRGFPGSTRALAFPGLAVVGHGAAEAGRKKGREGDGRRREGVCDRERVERETHRHTERGDRTRLMAPWTIWARDGLGIAMTRLATSVNTCPGGCDGGGGTGLTEGIGWSCRGEGSGT